MRLHSTRCMSRFNPSSQARCSLTASMIISDPLLERPCNGEACQPVNYSVRKLIRMVFLVRLLVDDRESLGYSSNPSGKFECTLTGSLIRHFSGDTLWITPEMRFFT